MAASNPAAAAVSDPSDTPSEQKKPYFTTHDIEGLAQYINERKPKKVMVMIGAGASVAAGIPDFRTPGIGLYSRLAAMYPELAGQPEAIFSIDAFRADPSMFYRVMTEMNMWPANYKPTNVHRFVKGLADKGMLLRCYTQNIDGLERATGLDPDLIVEAHGSFSCGKCIDCGAQYETSYVEEVAKAGKVPRCARCDGLVKPNVIFFGEALPDRFQRMLHQDHKACDLLIIIGTSLQVFPFARIPLMVPETVPRVLMTLDTAEDAPWSGTLLKFYKEDEPETAATRDLFLGGDCQVNIKKLMPLIDMERNEERGDDEAHPAETSPADAETARKSAKTRE